MASSQPPAARSDLRTFACRSYSTPCRPEGTRVFCPGQGKKRHTITTKYHAAAGKSAASESPRSIRSAGGASTRQRLAEHHGRNTVDTIAPDRHANLGAAAQARDSLANARQPADAGVLAAAA